MASKVKNAGSTEMRENPRVTSKYDRMHGEPRTPGHVSSPGGTTAPGGGKSGGAVAHNPAHTGHMQPRHVTPPAGSHKVTHHAPSELGTGMAEGRRQASSPHFKETDRVSRDGTRVGHENYMAGHDYSIGKSPGEPGPFKQKGTPWDHQTSRGGSSTPPNRLGPGTTSKHAGTGKLDKESYVGGRKGRGPSTR